MYPGNYRPPPNGQPQQPNGNGYYYQQPPQGPYPPPQGPYYQQQQPMPPMYHPQQPPPPHPQMVYQPNGMTPPQPMMVTGPPPPANQPQGMPTPNLPPGLLSDCRGTKKALLIGINYFRTSSELKGCINDVHNMKRFLVERFGFRDQPGLMVALTDDQMDPNYQPTRQNILNAIRWLVGGARPGDSLFFHFSGHGGLVPDKNGDEADGMDSCIYPVDFKQYGPIIDDDLNIMMVRHLPAGVRLTAVMDCCHSGTAMDLPYVYNHDGTLKSFNPGKSLLNTAQSAGKAFMFGSTVGAALSVAKGVMGLMNGGQSEQKARMTKSSMADVVMFSGCKDSQTSADTFVGGFGATGAMSFALIEALKQQPHQSYLTLLAHVRTILRDKYSQKPQLSTARPMDMNSYFYM